jgi:hypothetical protein
MKGATQCAKRLKSYFKKLRADAGKVSRPATGDPIAQLVLGVFSRDMPEGKAREALDAIKAHVVDYNEMRVIPASEIVEFVGELPDVRIKCEDISRSLNRIFAIEHVVSLDRVAKGGKTELAAYLNALPGLDAYTRARIRLLGLEQHAIPLDEAMWAAAVAEGFVDPKCTLEEAQAFLERSIDPSEALEFFSLLRKQAWADYGAAVRKGQTQKIRSVPPDRTTRNMLQMIASGNPLPELDALPDLVPLAEGDEEIVVAGKPAASKGGKSSAKPPAATKPAPAAKAAAPAKPVRDRKSGKSKVRSA